MPSPATCQRERAPRLPAGRLTAWIAGALIVGLAGTAAAAGMWRGAGSWPAWAAAAVIGVLAAASTLPLLRAGLRRVGEGAAAGGDVDPERKELHKAVRNVLLAGVARVVVFAAGVIISVQWLETARWPTFAFAGVLYLLLLAAEVGLVGRALWRSDAPGACPSAHRGAVPQGGGG